MNYNIVSLCFNLAPGRYPQLVTLTNMFPLESATFTSESIVMLWMEHTTALIIQIFYCYNKHLIRFRTESTATAISKIIKKDSPPLKVSRRISQVEVCVLGMVNMYYS